MENDASNNTRQGKTRNWAAKYSGRLGVFAPQVNHTKQSHLDLLSNRIPSRSPPTAYTTT
eukprot:6628397-Ditylum_brightwellii.AAC.1